MKTNFIKECSTFTSEMKRIYKETLIFQHYRNSHETDNLYLLEYQYRFSFTPCYIYFVNLLNEVNQSHKALYVENWGVPFRKMNSQTLLELKNLMQQKKTKFSKAFL